MKGSYLTERYVRRMQQGGGVGVFAPNPQPYRSPLQGLDPNVFRYEVNTKPLDTSGIIQVMQTKDNLAIQQEKMAADREQMALRRELQEKQLEFEEAKMMNTLMTDLFKASGGSQTFNKKGDVVYQNGDAAQSPRFKDMFLKLETEKAKALDEMMEARFLPSGQHALKKMMAASNKLRNLNATVPSTEIQNDEIAYQKFMAERSTMGSKIGMSEFQFANGVTKRADFYGGEDNGYKLGDIGKIVTYPVAETSKAFNKILEDALIGDKVKGIDSKKVPGSTSTVVVETEERVITDPKLAAEKVIAQMDINPQFKAYASNQFGLDLLEGDPKIVAPLLKEKLVKYFEAEQAADPLYGRVSQSLKKTITPKEDTNVNYNVTGGTTRAETRNTKVEGMGDRTIKVDYSKAPAAEVSGIAENVVANNAAAMGISKTSTSRKAAAVAAVKDLISSGALDPNDADQIDMVVTALATEDSPTKIKAAAAKLKKSLTKEGRATKDQQINEANWNFTEDPFGYEFRLKQGEIKKKANTPAPTKTTKGTKPFMG